MPNAAPAQWTDAAQSEHGSSVIPGPDLRSTLIIDLNKPKPSVPVPEALLAPSYAVRANAAAASTLRLP